VDLYLLSQKTYTNKKLINLTEFIQNLSVSSETRLWFQRRRDRQVGWERWRHPCAIPRVMSSSTLGMSFANFRICRTLRLNGLQK